MIEELNLKFKEIVVENSDCLAGNYLFDLYKNKDGEILLFSPYFNIELILENIHHISVINLKNNSVIKTLKGHEDRVLTLRYFQDPNSQNDYLISADRKYLIIIWDLTHDYLLKIKVRIRFESLIYGALLFNASNKLYAAIASVANDGTKVFNLEEPNNIINIRDSYFSTYFLTYWHDKKNNKDYIIQIGKKKILISEFPANETYDSFESDEKHPYNLGGLVFTNDGKELLAVSATYGLIQIYDLENKKVMLKIILENVFLYSFVRWKDNYLFVLDTNNKQIIVFDINDNDFKIKKEISCPEMYFCRFIQKVDHPLYGESILAIGIDYKIKLYTINKDD